MSEDSGCQAADRPVPLTPAGPEIFCPWSSILFLTDGEEHSEGALRWVLACASFSRASLSVLHVIDPYLKQFYNEIYSQGRREYLEHVESEIRGHGEKTLAEVMETAGAMAVEINAFTRYGDPLEEACQEAQQGGYDLLVTGGKKLSGLKAFKSGDMPSRLVSRLPALSIIIIREDS
jgi:nucleotide-binding universal stress UspA family protein